MDIAFGNQLLIRGLHGNGADPQMLGKGALGGQLCAGGNDSGGDIHLYEISQLLIERLFLSVSEGVGQHEQPPDPYRYDRSNHGIIVFSLDFVNSCSNICKIMVQYRLVYFW